MNLSETARWRVVVRSEWRFALALLVGAVVLGYACTIFGPLFDRKPVLLAVLPILMIGAAMLAVSLEWAVLALMLFRAGADPFLASTAMGGLTAGAVLNVAVIFIAIAFLIRHPRMVPRHVYLTWLPFLLLAFASCIYAPERGPALKIWSAWVTVASVHWISVYLVARGRTVDSLLRLVAYGSLIPALAGIVSVALHRSAAVEVGDTGDGFRLAGAFAHPNLFAFYLILMIPLVLYFWTADREDRKKHAWLWACYLVVLLGMLVLTKTRSAWAAALLILLVYGWKFDRRLLWGMIVVGPLLAFAIPDIRDRLVDLQSGGSYSANSSTALNSLAWRKLLWHQGFGFMRGQDWVWGRGLRSFDHYSVYFFTLAGKVEWGAHNVYVQLLFDTGVIGCAAYLWAYVYQLKFAVADWRDEPRRAYLIGAAVVGCLIVGYADNMLSYLVYNWYLWFVVGVITAVPMLRARERALERAQRMRFSATWR